MQDNKRVAIEFLLFGRPAGGPYRLVLHDGSRWKTPREYTQYLSFSSFDEENEETVLFAGPVHADEIETVRMDLLRSISQEVR